MRIKCPHCGKTADKPNGAVNRAKMAGLRIFCGRKCAGLGRRKGKTRAQLVAEKRVYDAEYRRKNRAMLKAKKSAYFQRTYDPEVARIERKKRMPRHVEYCRRPEYRKWKAQYDRRRTDAKYGQFAEANRAMMELNQLIRERTTRYDIQQQNQTGNKTQTRKRAAGQKERSRPRGRDRRDRHSAALG